MTHNTAMCCWIQISAIQIGLMFSESLFMRTTVLEISFSLGFIWLSHQTILAMLSVLRSCFKNCSFSAWIYGGCWNGPGKKDFSHLPSVLHSRPQGLACHQESLTLPASVTLHWVFLLSEQNVLIKSVETTTQNRETEPISVPLVQEKTVSLCSYLNHFHFL